MPLLIAVTLDVMVEDVGLDDRRFRLECVLGITTPSDMGGIKGVAG